MFLDALIPVVIFVCISFFMLEIIEKSDVLPHCCHAAVSIKISNLPICFCSFDLSCPLQEKDNFIENLYIVLFY